jgi:hypothetical protein
MSFVTGWIGSYILILEALLNHQSLKLRNINHKNGLCYLTAVDKHLDRF